MKRIIQGVDRIHGLLFPAQLDEYIAEDNCTRVIDAFIDMLKLKALGFDGAFPADTGRPQPSSGRNRVHIQMLNSSL